MRVGIAFATQPAELRALLDRFCAVLGGSLQLPASGLGVWHYHRLLEALEMGEVDVAWLPPILAELAVERGRVLPIALPVRDGAASYSTALIARGDSNLRSHEDVRGARVAWVDRRSASGYLVIRAHLRSIGADLDRMFAADQFVGAHDAVARAVQEREADVGATYVHFDPVTGIPVRSGWGDLDMRVIAHAGPIPADVIAIGTHVPEALRESIQRAFVEPAQPELAAAANALFNAERFIASEPAHFAPLRALLGDLDEHAQRLPTQAPRPSWPSR